MTSVIMCDLCGADDAVVYHKRDDRSVVYNRCDKCFDTACDIEHSIYVQHIESECRSLSGRNKALSRKLGDRRKEVRALHRAHERLVHAHCRYGRQYNENQAMSRAHNELLIALEAIKEEFERCESMQSKVRLPRRMYDIAVTAIENDSA